MPLVDALQSEWTAEVVKLNRTESGYRLAGMEGEIEEYVLKMKSLGTPIPLIVDQKKMQDPPISVWLRFNLRTFMLTPGCQSVKEKPVRLSDFRRFVTTCFTR